MPFIDVLRRADLVESKEDEEQRKTIVSRISNYIANWATSVAFEKKGMTETISLKGNSKILPFGSYRLLNHNCPFSDVDLLCVFCCHVSREDVFVGLSKLLESHVDIDDLLVIANAYVPIITFKFSGVPVDLVFAILTVPKIPENFDLTQDSQILLMSDKESLRSLIGYKSSERILSLVPNVEEFCSVLKIIKHWAKKRGIYSTKFGYLGGAAWTILVANICQRFPQLSEENLILEFYKTFSRWDWSVPVALDGAHPKKFMSYMEKNGEQCMSIIAPVFPSINSAFSVGKFTQKIIIEELYRGKNLLYQILKGNLPWDALFDEHTEFFMRYDSYLRLDVSASSDTSYRTWTAFLKSKCKCMTRLLEQNYNILFVHPSPICHSTPNTPANLPSPYLSTLPPATHNTCKPLSTTIYFGLHTKQMIPYSALVFSASKFVFEIIDEWGQRTPDMEVHPFLVQRQGATSLADTYPLHLSKQQKAVQVWVPKSADAQQSA